MFRRYVLASEAIYALVMYMDGHWGRELVYYNKATRDDRPLWRPRCLQRISRWVTIDKTDAFFMLVLNQHRNAS